MTIRAPLFVNRRILPPEVRAFVGANLLVTTLAVTAAPFVSAQTFTAPQHPSHRLVLNQNTSAGMPKCLYADTLSTIADQTHTAPAWRKWVNPDTSESTPKTLYGDSLTKVTQQTAAAPERSRWLPADTSQDTPKTLTPDEVFSPAMPESLPPQRPKRIWSETSLSSPLALLQVPAQAPFIVAPHLGPVRTNWKAPDTSQATPKTLFGDEAAAFKNPPHTAPDRVRPVTDTSRGTPKTLYGDASLPAQNLQHTAPDRVRPVTDTSQGTPKVLYDDAVAPFFNPAQRPPDRVRPVVDTSESTPLTLTTLVVEPIPPGQAVYIGPAEFRLQVAHQWDQPTFPEFIPPPTPSPLPVIDMHDGDERKKFKKRKSEEDRRELLRSAIDPAPAPIAPKSSERAAPVAEKALTYVKPPEDADSEQDDQEVIEAFIRMLEEEDRAILALLKKLR